MSIEKERERRQSETNELRRLFDKEQDRAVFAIREAEKNSTKVESFQMQAEKAELELQGKDRKLESLSLVID